MGKISNAISSFLNNTYLYDSQNNQLLKYLDCIPIQNNLLNPESLTISLRYLKKNSETKKITIFDSEKDDNYLRSRLELNPLQYVVNYLDHSNLVPITVPHTINHAYSSEWKTPIDTILLLLIITKSKRLYRKFKFYGFNFQDILDCKKHTLSNYYINREHNENYKVQTNIRDTKTRVNFNSNGFSHL